MPTYVYECEQCGRREDRARPVSRRNAEIRPCVPHVCDGPMKRVLVAPGVIFKGTGFYETDYKQKRPPKGGSQL